MKEIPNPIYTRYVPGYMASDEHYPQARNGFPNIPEDSQFQKIDMQPGSVLFVPRGMWHKTHANEDSLSISISMHPPVALDAVLFQLQAMLMQDPEWRKPLYGINHTNGELTKYARELTKDLLSDLPNKVHAMSIGNLQRSCSSERARFQLLDENSYLQRVPNSRVIIRELENGSNLQAQIIEIIIAGNTLSETRVWQVTMRPRGVLLIRWISNQSAAFTVKQVKEQFSELESKEIQEMFDFCHQAGLLKALTTSMAPLTNCNH